MKLRSSKQLIVSLTQRISKFKATQPNSIEEIKLGPLPPKTTWNCLQLGTMDLHATCTSAVMSMIIVDKFLRKGWYLGTERFNC